MTRDENRTFRFGTGTITSVIVLMAGSCLVMSGTTARPASWESSTVVHDERTALQTSSNDSPADPQSEKKNESETIVTKQHLGADVSSADKSDPPPKNTKKPR